MLVVVVGQSQIRRRLSEPESVERVLALTTRHSSVSRTELADLVCDELGFVDWRGRRQRSGCLKALRLLERRGRLVLPAARTKSGPSQPRRLESSVPLPEGVPGQVDQVSALELVLVDDEDGMRVWNSLLLDEHPRGAGPLVGRQLRYLVRSEHGVLGALGFAAAALHLLARDRWIGWDFESRQAQLDRVLGLSRFLIRPSVQCRNLASHVLSLVVARLPDDFEARYGYRPWLVETFVDTTQFAGTCYRAANWIRVGSSQGRGRQDRANAGAETIKDIYVHVLAPDFRARLGLSEHAGLGPLPVSAEQDSQAWPELEFGGAPLGDARLSQRLVRSAIVQAHNPMNSFPGAAGDDQAAIKGHYRLLDQPDESAVTMENILLPHREQTLRRMQAEKTALCIHDGTDLDYNGASECVGLGPIGSNQTGAKSRGLHLHSTFVVNDKGLPLGVLSARCDAPAERSPDDARSPVEVPIEEKKTYDWLLAVRDCEAAAATMPHTKIVQVMDREADFFELFDEWSRGARRTHLLVRAKHNRRTAQSENLFDAVRATPERLRFELHVGRQSARLKKSKQKARPKRKERTAEMTLRYREIQIPPPRYLRDHLPISLCIVHAVEEQPPPDAKPIEWFLLTTMAVASPEQALRVLKHYCLRWRIEDWHRVLKTGCGIEQLRNETATRLKRALAIYMVIGWRIMLMALLGREEPGLLPEVLFSDLEIEVLTAYAKYRGNLKPPETLGEAVRFVARLGGYQDRKNAPPPGNQVLWTGYVKLSGMCAGYLIRDRQSGGADPPPSGDG